MKIEQAIVHVLALAHRGMTTIQIAKVINKQQLHVRRDGQPVTSAQIYAVICHYPDVFTKDGGLIHLLM